jgi:tetratricopeptide (TPR) repeat protein
MATAYEGTAQFFGHDFEAAEATLRAALAIGDEGFDDVTADAALVLGVELIAINRHPEAQPYLALLERYQDRLDPFGQALWGWVAGRYATWEGRFDEALQKFDRGRAAASRSVTHLLFHRWTEAQARAGKGDYEAALAELDDTLATGERVGDGVTRMRIFNIVGWIYGDLGDSQRALEWNQRGVEASRAMAMPTPEVEMQSLLNVVENLICLGRLDEAGEYLREVEVVVRHPQPKQRWMHWRYSQRFLLDSAELALERGDPTQATEYAQECLAMAERTLSRKHVAMARRLKGRALLIQREFEGAEAELTAALKLAEEVGNPPQLWKSHVALGDLRMSEGRSEEARQAYGNALAVIDQVAASLTDESLRATFLASAHVLRIRATAESCG